ncbi:MAG: NUDIX domain-containing protein [Candidatus Pacebacteria bacterium]|nr:NUDIX domain-containing protein [Candidatus Paceibacterota bacterium]MDD4074303.1 NUDIX domain-containing protein [Candidatus Paceibacterota bacterium]
MKNKFGIALKAMIKNDKNEYLVLFKSDKEDINPKQIDIPGGRMEFGESFKDSLEREVKEELGIEVEINNHSSVWNLIKDDFHLVGITFNAKYIGGEIKLSFEHDNYSWLKKEDVFNSKYPEWLKDEFMKAD